MGLRYLVLIAAVSALPACATNTISPVASAPPPPPERALAYNNATRLIRLSDGSDFLLIPRESPNERTSIEALLVSPKGRDEDRHFRVSRWISSVIGDGTIGQIYSAALSPDGEWLAATAGWWGKDNRGHNGIFMMRHATRGGLDFFDLKNWFDVRGLTIGDVEFGPDDTLLTISQENRPDQPSPIVTLFSYAGQNLGSFIPSPNHGDPRSASFARLMRLSRTGPSSFVIYDPEATAARWIHIVMTAGRPQVVEDRRATIPAERPRIPVLAFSALSNGHLVVARNLAQDRHPRTIVSVYATDGREIESWQSPEIWTYGATENSTVHGYSLAPTADRVTHSTVSVH
ncbi:MAG: hypothetical protein QOE82_249 [Thermoanaerobaculia bacterium]|jgi:hypothetical protein|nr:hypothetical protein [Thermoanaerobaculia bacterium]